jgi:hypothetical protein
MKEFGTYKKYIIDDKAYICNILATIYYANLVQDKKEIDGEIYLNIGELKEVQKIKEKIKNEEYYIVRNNKKYYNVRYIENKLNMKYPVIWKTFKDKIKFSKFVLFNISNYKKNKSTKSTKSIKVKTTLEKAILEQMKLYIKDDEATQRQSNIYFSLTSKAKRIVFWADVNLIEIYNKNKIQEFLTINEFLDKKM